MPVPSERLAGWLSPKWLVAGVALAAEGLLVNYDLRLAAAAGVLIAVVVAAWLYIAVRFGSLSGTPSVRAALVEQATRQSANRRSAESQMAVRSGAQQGAEPAKRP
jgi:hypothetical protein